MILFLFQKAVKKLLVKCQLEEKNKISHRARAINKLKKFLIRSFN